MTCQPLVSVIIPVFNCEKYVAAAIESALAQTYSSKEIIVVNDGSTDNTAEVISSYADRIRVFSQENRGISAARNLAVENARGEFYAFLDADDLWEPEKTDLQMKVMLDEPAVGVVFGGIQNFVSPDLAAELREQIVCSAEIVPTQLPSAMLVRRSAYELVGPFSADLRRAEGIDWFARARDAGLQIQTLEQLLVRRRIFKTSAEAADRSQMKGYAHALKRALDRRRALDAAKTEVVND